MRLCSPDGRTPRRSSRKLSADARSGDPLAEGRSERQHGVKRRHAAVKQCSTVALDPGVRLEVVLKFSDSESKLRGKASSSQNPQQDETLLQARHRRITGTDGIDQSGDALDVDIRAIQPGAPTDAA